MEDQYRTKMPWKKEDARFLVNWVSRDPNFANHWLPLINQSIRDGTFTHENVQAGIRLGVSQAWAETCKSPLTPDTMYQTIYAHAFPNSGTMSFLLQHPIVFVKDINMAGGMAVLGGARGTGKTETM